jgi:hypothetical protein
MLVCYKCDKSLRPLAIRQRMVDDGRNFQVLRVVRQNCNLGISRRSRNLTDLSPVFLKLNCFY